MTDLWPLTRPGVQAQAMHYSYEKGGLVIDNQPIPWNADAIVVECLARLPATAARRKDEFLLRIPGRDPIPLDNLRRDESDGRYRLHFRMPALSETSNAEIVWRHHRLSEMTLPVIQRAEFLQKLRLQHPTLSVRLGDQAVACQTFVTPQCRGVLAGAVLNSPTSLAPLIDLGFHVDWRREGSVEGKTYPVRLSSSQLKSKQALITVCPTNLPKRTGTYVASWIIDDQVLATQRLRAISRSHFLRSLRISETRLVVQTKNGAVHLARHLPPLDGITRIGPCFLVSSSEVGMAGLCPLCVCGQLKEGVQMPVLLDQELLLTDGPAPFVPGTLDVREVEQMAAFELHAGARTLGVLSLTPAPTAAFDAEGGFKAIPEYMWSSAAEDQLQEKLAKLLTGEK